MQPLSLLNQRVSYLRKHLNLATIFVVLISSVSPGQTKLTIRVLNARTNQPILDERLNVAFRADQIGSVALATDKNGLIVIDLGKLDPGKATTLRILANMYADCRPRAELYTDYSLTTLRNNGITAGNLCSSASPAPKPGQLLLYEIPKTFIPGYGKPPNTTLPPLRREPQRLQTTFPVITPRTAIHRRSAFRSGSARFDRSTLLYRQTFDRRSSSPSNAFLRPFSA